MEIIITIVLIILFIIIMLFSFLLGMLTKLIRTRDIGMVILIGIILGGIGGLVCITPISGDIPQFVGSCAQLIYSDDEVLTVELKPESNVDNSINSLQQVGGVINVTNDGLIIHTSKFSDYTSEILDNNMENAYPNITNWNINNKEGLISVNVSDGNYYRAAETMKGPLYDNYNISYNYAMVELTVNAKADSVDHIKSLLSENDVAVTEVSGPVNDIVNATASNMPSNQSLVLISAILGGVLSVVGIFIDQIRRGLTEFRRKKR